MVNLISVLILNYINNKNLVSDEKFKIIDNNIRGMISTFIIVLGLIFTGIIFNCLLEVIIITIISNVIRQFSGGIHFNLKFCTLFSIIFITLLSIISKITYQYSFQIFLVINAFIILSIIKIPNIPKQDKTHDDNYYRNGFILLFFIIYLIQLCCIFLDSFQILNAINFGFISVLLTLVSINTIIERVILFMPYGERKKSGEKNERRINSNST